MDDNSPGGRSGGAANSGQARDLAEVGQSKSPASSRNNSPDCPTENALGGRARDWTDHDGGACPIDGEQRVEVKWRDPWLWGTTTRQRAGALNWSGVEAYRLMPNPEHAR